MLDKIIQKLKRKRDQRLHDAFQRAFNNEQGRLVLVQMARECHLIDPMYRQGIKCCDLAFLEGKRHVLLSILKMLNRGPDDLLKLIEETENERQRDESEYATAMSDET